MAYTPLNRSAQRLGTDKETLQRFRQLRRIACLEEGERNTWRTIRNIRRSSFFTFNGKGGSTLCRLAKSWLSKSRHTQPRARASCLRRKEATRGPSQGLGSPTDFPCSAPYSDMRCNLRREGGSPPTAVIWLQEVQLASSLPPDARPTSPLIGDRMDNIGHRHACPT